MSVHKPTESAARSRPAFRSTVLLYIESNKRVFCWARTHHRVFCIYFKSTSVYSRTRLAGVTFYVVSLNAVGHQGPGGVYGFTYGFT